MRGEKSGGGSKSGSGNKSADGKPQDRKKMNMEEADRKLKELIAKFGKN
jgi:hypothetical protein